MVEKKTGFSITTIILLFLLGIRSVGQIQGIFDSPVLAIFEILYISAFVCVLLKNDYGSILAIVVGIIDLLGAFYLGVFDRALIWDVVIIISAYLEYKNKKSNTDTN